MRNARDNVYEETAGFGKQFGSDLSVLACQVDSYAVALLLEQVCTKLDGAQPYQRPVSPQLVPFQRYQAPGGGEAGLPKLASPFYVEASGIGQNWEDFPFEAE